MIDLHYWPTPNGHKVTLFLEEAGLPYRIVPVDIRAGDQFKPDFLAIAPNNRMPAIVDHDPKDGGGPLLYLAQKTGRFVPASSRGRMEVMEWLMWQVSGLGPMLGQNHHFTRYAPEPVPYAIDRYKAETARLYGVLGRRLAGREFIADGYSIADMACYPWVASHEWHHVDLADYPEVRRWHDAIKERPATVAAYARGKELTDATAEMTDEQRRVLFGQGGTGGAR